MVFQHPLNYFSVYFFIKPENSKSYFSLMSTEEIVPQLRFRLKLFDKTFSVMALNSVENRFAFSYIQDLAVPLVNVKATKPSRVVGSEFRQFLIYFELAFCISRLFVYEFNALPILNWQNFKFCKKFLVRDLPTLHWSLFARH